MTSNNVFKPFHFMVINVLLLFQLPEVVEGSLSKSSVKIT
jgi:hypothetical protein